MAISSAFCEPSGDFSINGSFYDSIFMDGNAHIASFEMAYGKGKVFALTFALAEYSNRPTSRMRRFVGAVADKAWPAPAVKITGSQYIEVTVMKKDGKRCINLINSLNGTRFTSEGIKLMTFDEIPPLHDIDLEIRWPVQPKAVMIEPEHRAAGYNYENGVIRMTLDKLEIHAVITVE